MRVFVNKIFSIGNVSKSLAVEINLLLSITNQRYVDEFILDGDPKPGIRKDSLGNLFAKYRFKEMKPKETFPVIMQAQINTKKLDLGDWLLQDKKRAQTRRKIMMVYPEGLRRIKKIAERLFRKSNLLIDFEKEITEFIQRNFELMKTNEGVDGDLVNLENLIKTNRGTLLDIVNFAIALHKHNNILTRRVEGYIIDQEIRKYYWIELKVGKNWIPVDVVRGYYGFIPENYLAKKIDYTEKSILDIQALYKLNKRWLGRAIVVVEEEEQIFKA